MRRPFPESQPSELSLIVEPTVASGDELLTSVQVVLLVLFSLRLYSSLLIPGLRMFLGSCSRLEASPSSPAPATLLLAPCLVVLLGSHFQSWFQLGWTHFPLLAMEWGSLSSSSVGQLLGHLSSTSAAKAHLHRCQGWQMQHSHCQGHS